MKTKNCESNKKSYAKNSYYCLIYYMKYKKINIKINGKNKGQMFMSKLKYIISADFKQIK